MKFMTDWNVTVLFDNFKAQITSNVFTLLDHNNINIVLNPPNCTDRLQPLDIGVNKAVKDHLHREFQSWYAEKSILGTKDKGNKNL